MADSTTPPPEPPEPGAHWSFTRADLALVRRAAREHWGVPDRLKAELLYQVAGLLASSDPDLDPRLKVAIGRLLAQLDRNDLAAAKLELERRKLERPDAAGDARDAWAGIASELLADADLDARAEPDPPRPPAPA